MVPFKSDENKMKIEEIKQEILQQDNLGTHLPIFMVQDVIRVYGVEECHSDQDVFSVWVDEDNEEVDEELWAKLDELDEFCLPHEFLGHNKIFYKEIWVNVMPFFTKVYAEKFMIKISQETPKL